MSSKHNVAVLAALPSRTALLADSLEMGNIEAIVCTSSDEFCQVVRQQRVDAVVIEHELPGFLSGLDIVERLIEDLLRPVVVLLTQDVAGLRSRASKARLDVLLPGDAEPARIAEALQSSLLAMTHSGVRIPYGARMLVRDADYVPPMPQLLVQLSRYLNDENASIADLTKDISTDPRITAELLKLVNNSAMGLRGKVTRVFDAVNLLGIKRTVALVLSASVVGSHQTFLQSLPDSFDRWFRPRNVLIGATASAFAARLTRVSADTAYVLGLLQDLGILLMARTLGSRYLTLLERCRTVGHLQLAVVEQQDYQFNHAAVSAALFQRWELPPSIIRMVLEHHLPPGEVTCSETERQFLNVMRVGEAVADLHDVTCPQRHAQLMRMLRPFDEAPSELCKGCLASAVARTREFSELFTTPVPNPEQLEQLMEDISQQIADGPRAADDDEGPAVAPEDDASTGAAGEEIAEAVASRQTPASAELPATGRGGVGESEGPMILVVEDESAVANLIRHWLHPFGIRVCHAEGARSALALAGEATAILCDVHLAGESGTAIVRELRASGAEVPVLMISGDCTRGTVEECIEVGINDYILKPIVRDKLFEKLRKHTGLPLESGAARKAAAAHSP